MSIVRDDCESRLSGREIQLNAVRYEGGREEGVRTEGKRGEVSAEQGEGKWKRDNKKEVVTPEGQATIRLTCSQGHGIPQLHRVSHCSARTDPQSSHSQT